MNKQIIKGDELMVFYEGKSLAYATSHTFTITGNSNDIATKDHGYWGAKEVGNMTWEASSENLFVEAEYEKLFDAMIDKTPIDIIFGRAGVVNSTVTKEYSEFAASGIVNGVDEPDHWQANSGHIFYQGKAFITSLTANANTGENATYSITFSGSGSLKKLPAA